jgi:response regulator NasT
MDKPADPDRAGSRPLRIVVADEDPNLCQAYEAALTRLGHQVCAARNRGQAVELCRTFSPDLLVTASRMPDANGIAAAHEVCRGRPIPVILVADRNDRESIARALDAPVQAYLVKPVEEADLEPAIALVTRRFAEYQALRREAAELRQALEDRKLIERAKGVVMRRVGLDEEEAFRRLRRFASERNKKLAEVARTILEAEEVFAAFAQADPVAARPGEGRA